MRSASWDDRVRWVRTLLERERRMIRAGDLRGLSAHASRSGAALEQLLAGTPPPRRDGAAEARLADLRETAESNRRLLEAVLAGIAEAKAIASERTASAARLGYGRDGAPVERAARPSRERRA